MFFNVTSFFKVQHKSHMSVIWFRAKKKNFSKLESNSIRLGSQVQRFRYHILSPKKKQTKMFTIRHTGWMILHLNQGYEVIRRRKNQIWQCNQAIYLIVETASIWFKLNPYWKKRTILLALNSKRLFSVVKTHSISMMNYKHCIWCITILLYNSVFLFVHLDFPLNFLFLLLTFVYKTAYWLLIVAGWLMLYWQYQPSQ